MKKQLVIKRGILGGTSLSIQRRLRDSRFATRYFRGVGLDIGGGSDSLALYAEFFPLIRDLRLWDLEDGDAQLLEGLEDESFEFVYSSHCLEHLVDPTAGLANWFRVLKKGGYLVVTIPDEDLYEQGEFPSTFNPDHKWTFTIYKEKSWCDKSLNVFDALTALQGEKKILKVELLDSGFRTQLPRFDQTLTPVCESGIEFIVQKL